MAELTMSVTQGALQLLHSCLMRPGWAKEPVLLYRAGSIAKDISGLLIADPMPRLLLVDAKEVPKPEVIEAHNATVEAWASKPASLGISAKDYEVCKTCISTAVQAGGLVPTEHYMALAEALGLAGK